MSKSNFKQINSPKDYSRLRKESISVSTKFEQNKSGITIRLDRLVMAGDTFPLPCVKEIAGFSVVSDFRPQQLGKVSTYSRVRKFRSRSTSTLIGEQYIKLKPWLPRCRFTLIGDDQGGISAAEIASLSLEIIGPKVTLFELAFDFPRDLRVNETFVRKHGLFGKSRLRKTEFSGLLRLGSRASTKLVRCYQKDEVEAYRVEIQANSGLLRRYGIKKAADLPRFACQLCPAHIRFAALAKAPLKKHLIRKFGSEGMLVYQEAMRRARSSLRSALRYLNSVHVTNSSRFLAPLPINDAIRQAIQQWASKFARQYKESLRKEKRAA